MTRNWIVGGLALAVAAASAGCGGSEYVKKNRELQDTIEQDMAGGKFITAIGIGAADDSLTNKTQRRALSRDAAIVKAQYELLSMVKKVTVEGGITVAQAMEKDSTIEARVNEALSGAEIVKSEWTADDGCVVTLRIPKRRLQTAMGVKFE